MPVDVAAYLDRLGIAAPTVPDLATLTALQRAHLRAIPFENLSIHLDETISLDTTALLDKIVARGRGGFCYEVNGAFAWLLTELGYHVTMLAAGVYRGPELGPLFDHVALRVDLDRPWLADVGFGAFATEPLRLDDRGDQTDPAGTFRIAEAEHGDLIVHENNEPQYRLETRPRELTEFEAMCWYQQNSPTSQFSRSPVCSRLTGTGRVTLPGRTLKTVTNGQTTQTSLGDDATILTAYREHFGITLDRPPRDPRET